MQVAKEGDDQDLVTAGDHGLQRLLIGTETEDVAPDLVKRIDAKILHGHEVANAVEKILQDPEVVSDVARIHHVPAVEIDAARRHHALEVEIAVARRHHVPEVAIKIARVNVPLVGAKQVRHRKAMETRRPTTTL